MNKRDFLATAAAMALFPLTATAQTDVPEAVAAWRAAPELAIDAADLSIADFQWIARPVVVFADSANDPAFAEQMDLLENRVDELIERDVVVIYDTNPGTLSDVRRQLRPRGFMLALLGKDGQVKLRKPRPYDVRELSRSIDKMPMRQREIDDRRAQDQ